MEALFSASHNPVRVSGDVSELTGVCASSGAGHQVLGAGFRVWVCRTTPPGEGATRRHPRARAHPAPEGSGFRVWVCRTTPSGEGVHHSVLHQRVRGLGYRGMVLRLAQPRQCQGRRVMTRRSCIRVEGLG